MFKNSLEYLSHIKSILEEREGFVLYPENYRAQILNIQKKDSYLRKYTQAEINHQQPLLDAFTTFLYRVLDTPERERYEKEVAVSTLIDSNFNARIYKHKHQDYYAIFLNLGLMQMVNEFWTFSYAEKYPNSISFVKSPKTLSETASISKKKEFLLSYYKSNKSPTGAQLILDKDISAECSFNINIVLLFLLSHEVAHYINGDLNGREFFQVIQENNLEYLDNLDHHKEYSADYFAWNVITKGVNIHSLEWDEDSILEIITNYFIFTYMIGFGASSTHPHPLDRALMLLGREKGKNRECNAWRQLKKYCSSDELMDERIEELSA